MVDWPQRWLTIPPIHIYIYIPLFSFSSPWVWADLVTCLPQQKIRKEKLSVLVLALKTTGSSCFHCLVRQPPAKCSGKTAEDSTMRGPCLHHAEQKNHQLTHKVMRNYKSLLLLVTNFEVSLIYSSRGKKKTVIWRWSIAIKAWNMALTLGPDGILVGQGVGWAMRKFLLEAWEQTTCFI